MLGRSSSLQGGNDLALTLHSTHAVSRSEITHVSLSTTAALAIYPSIPNTPQSWIDTFTLTPSLSSPNSSRKKFSKTPGSLAAYSPLVGHSRVATLRDWTVQLPGGVEYHHATSLMVRDVDSGKPALEIRAVCPGGPLAWSRQAHWIAAAETGGVVPGERVGVWDAATGARVGRVVGHVDRVTHLAFTPRGSLVTLSRDGTLRLTDPFTGRTSARLEIDGGGGGGGPRALAVSRDGQSVVFVWGTRVVIWHPEADAALTSYGLPAVRSVEGWPLCLSADGKYLTCRTEAGFDVMDVASATVVCARRTEDIVTAGAFSPDTSMLLLGRMDGVVEAWDIEKATS